MFVNGNSKSPSVIDVWFVWCTHSQADVNRISRIRLATRLSYHRVL